jgi:hypothetical protein
MWAERMVEAVPELKFIQINTDGITIMIPKDKLELIRQVNNQLTKETTLVIEEAFYSKMFIRDVNNYGAVYTDSTREHEHIKLKGDFEVDKEFHKDPSMRIVPLALKNYFVYGTPIADTIKENKDIFNFCMRLKTNSKSTPYFKYLDGNTIKNKKLDRTTRYYISNNGGTIYKDFTDKKSGINVGYSITLFNKYVKLDNWNDYNIDYRFYINEANKIKNVIVYKELDLFE